MNKFVENSVKKQDQSYQIGFAKKNFVYSCEMCAGRGLANGQFTCANCPIKEAHIRALTEIQLGKRTKPEKVRFSEYGASKFHNDKFHKVTIVVRFD